MSKPNKKHIEWCKNYKSRGQREINKAIKQERHKKRLAKLAKRKEENKVYVYEPNPFPKGTSGYEVQKTIRALGHNEDRKNSMPEFQRLARVFGRLDRDMRAIEEAARQEEIKQKRSGKKKKNEESEN